MTWFSRYKKHFRGVFHPMFSPLYLYPLQPKHHDRNPYKHLNSSRPYPRIPYLLFPSSGSPPPKPDYKPETEDLQCRTSPSNHGPKNQSCLDCSELNRPPHRNNAQSGKRVGDRRPPPLFVSSIGPFDAQRAGCKSSVAVDRVSRWKCRSR
ncbi:hypothetical protein K402DRAFT_19670 [Aulographum hederae CBS 113979]|uniref:Uncharacterized protein n=1 Tax=Aulographum hederae CBS 113979 TaxID=1176131 RepID=A0A6G1H6Y0_9PEZI|nr:hypothetical protein K402DRAFT_19670 [Aulographum hederae CBS 113979]